MQLIKICKVLAQRLAVATYKLLSGKTLEEAVVEADLFEDDQAFSLLALVERHGQVLLAEQKTIGDVFIRQRSKKQTV